MINWTDGGKFLIKDSAVINNPDWWLSFSDAIMEYVGKCMQVKNDILDSMIRIYCENQKCGIDEITLVETQEVGRITFHIERMKKNSG